MELTPTMEAAALLGFGLQDRPQLSAAVDVLLAEMERLKEIEHAAAMVVTAAHLSDQHPAVKRLRDQLGPLP